ncbi:putative senescence/spartin-associated [Medicago truncatula]|uniref:Late embryogenesis abundant domain protein n=1 Tax=Medicago truncatula TaxID=3880 RepID=G7ISC1_MEDTR|nr:uncharacterized protein ECU03_1610 [Medicago truncatula]AES63854.1 late embryogenesis abundant domain protein [Medicago truncatula]RHN71955.1 putative senescence/spartin-associated [Medicago truncatula]
MAATMLTGNTLFQTSNSFPNVPSLSLPKPSRIFLASNWRNASEGTKNNSLSWAYTSSTKTRIYADGTADKAKETVNAGIDDIKQFGQDANEKTKDAASSIADKAKEDTDKAVEAVGSAGDKVKDYAYDANDKTKEAIGSATDKAKEGFEAATKNTQEAAGSATEALKNAGDQAKEAVEGALDAAKNVVAGKE